MTDSYVYFLYSEKQFAKRKEIDAKISKTFTLGYVIVRGQKKFFTEMSKSMTNGFPDTKIIAEGYKSTMSYTLPKSV